MRTVLLLLFATLSISLHAQQKADTVWKQDVGGSSLGMLLPDGKPILLNGRNVRAIDPQSGRTIWETNIEGYATNVGYYKGTPYLDLNGYVVNPLNGAALNLGKASKTSDGKPIDIIRNYVFPSLNVVLVYGKVKQGVIEGNVDEVFCAIDYTTGRTLWTRNDMFRSAEQKQEKKGFGGLLKQAGNELIKDDLQKHEDFKNAGERFLTEPVGTREGTLLLPLNLGVYAIEINTGNVVWKKPYAVKKKGIITTKTDDPTCVITLSSDSGTLYVSRADFTDALNVKSGSSVWKDPMPSAGPASFLHLTDAGVLSLPTKDVTMLQNKRIRLFDAATGEIKWEIKHKYGVQSFIPMGHQVALNLQNAGDKESVNVLDLGSGKLQFEKNVAVDGSVLTMKSIPAGILVVSDEELCIIDKSGEKKSTLAKKKDKEQWILSASDNELYVIISGDNKVYQFDYTTGMQSKLLSEEIDFKGKEDVASMEWYKGKLLLSSPQNLCYIDTKEKKIIYQKYYKAPGRTVAGKILSGVTATVSFTASLAYAGTTMYTGLVTGAIISSDISTVAYQLYPQETDAFMREQLSFMAQGAQLTGESFQEGLAMIRSIGARFKSIRTEKDNVYVMGNDDDGDFALLQVAKSTGDVLRVISLRKRDKQPEFLVDEEANCVYYIPHMTFGDEIKSIIKNTGFQLLKIDLK